MRLTTGLAVAAQFLLGDSAVNGFFFNDIKPRDYKAGTELDVQVGHLTSFGTVAKQPFYLLNYCASTGPHHYVDG